MKLKLRTRTITFTVELEEDSTVQDLKEVVKEKTLLNMKEMNILIGFPPRSLVEEGKVKLKDCNIQSGDSLIVEDLNVKKVQNSEEENNSKFPRISVSNLRIPRGFALINRELIPEEICLVCTKAKMIRISVPSDNSCLFSSVYLITHGGTLDLRQSNSLRKIIAEAIAKEPETFDSVYLGKPNEEYCQWILNPNNWGGFIELTILSEYFQIEITVLYIMTGAIIRVGNKHKSRGILIYDGIHYDPLVFECSHLCRTIFSTQDVRFLNLAMKFVKEAQIKNEFTDLKDFKIRCVTCGVYLQGKAEVKDHVSATRHINFEQIKV